MGVTAPVRAAKERLLCRRQVHRARSDFSCLGRVGGDFLPTLAACNGASTTTTGSAATATPTRAAATPASTPTGRYTAHLLLHGSQRPDDLTFDLQGRLLFSDYYAGTVSRLNVDGSITVLLSGLAGPEGLVMLSDGTLIIAEQRTNRILSVAPYSTSPTVLRDLPGANSGVICKEGVDSIALDPTNTTLIVPDSPTGDVYRMSVDGGSLTKIASGIVRPVGAVVDVQGKVYVSDECGGAVVRITPSRASAASACPTTSPSIRRAVCW